MLKGSLLFLRGSVIFIPIFLFLIFSSGGFEYCFIFTFGFTRKQTRIDIAESSDEKRLNKDMRTTFNWKNECFL